MAFLSECSEFRIHTFLFIRGAIDNHHSSPFGNIFMSIEVQGNTKIRRTLNASGRMSVVSSARFACVTAGVMALSCSGNVHAQSSVTLYGKIDAGVRYVSAFDGQHSNTYLATGGMNPDEWGIKGSEDLGGGMRAVFQLENQFSAANGSAPPISTSPQMFGRQAFVGLDTDNYGELTFGHQYNAMNVLFNYAPIWVDGASPFYVAGDNFALGYRINSSAVYQKSFGPVAIQLDYGLGGQPGSTAKGRTVGGSTTYTFASGTIGGAYEQFKSADGTSLAQDWTAGGRYTLGSASLFAGYMHDAVSGTEDQRRNLYFGGAQYYVTPAFLLSGGYFYYEQSSCNGACTPGITAAGGSSGGQIYGLSAGGGVGHGNILALSAQYFLSKRTQLYLEADTYRLRGGAARDQVYYWTGTDNSSLKSVNQNAVMLGMTHSF
jgi:predicted porin